MVMLCISGLIIACSYNKTDKSNRVLASAQVQGHSSAKHGHKNNKRVSLPSEFCPNSGMANAKFFPKCEKIKLVKTMIVYNRQGEEVYHANNLLPGQYALGWDGTYKGHDLPSDIFIYSVSAVGDSNEPIDVKGFTYKQ